MMKIALLTGGGDKPYALGLLNALINRGAGVDFIGNDEMSSAEIITHKNVNFLICGVIRIPEHPT